MNWKASRLPACTAPASTIRISRSITISSAPITCRAPPAQNRGETLVSHLLKSNCLITHQPDWGSVQIQYRGRKSTASSSCAIWFRSATITNSMSSASNVSLTIFSVSASRNRFPFTPAIRDAAVWISTPGAAMATFPRHRPPRPSIINNFTICVRLGARKVVETPFAGLL